MAALPTVFYLSAKRSHPHDALTAASDDQTRSTALVTQQGLASFAGGTFLVTVIWKVAKAAISGSWADKTGIIPVILAAIWGVYMLTAPGQGSGFNARLGAVLCALVNAAQVWGSAVGFDDITT